MTSSSGFVYSEASFGNAQPHFAASFESAAGAGMIGFPSVEESDAVLWKQCFAKATTGGGRQSDAPLWSDEQSSGGFPCKGLSLSLSSSNHLELQEITLRQHGDFTGFGPSSSLSVNLQPLPPPPPQVGFPTLRDSVYLRPAQDLLKELCSISFKQTETPTPSKRRDKKHAEHEDETLEKNQSHLLELQRRKKKLLQMLDEVEKRYKLYCNQMAATVSLFEAAAGKGSAKVYSATASKAMSRHFRCMRDGIVSQIRATKKAMGDQGDAAVPRTTRGDTPRLRLVDQTLRQQKGFNQTNFTDIHPWRPQRGLPERAVTLLRAWLFEHFLHPYPSDVDKHVLARQTGLAKSQVSNWFINARVRLWKPMVEEMYLEELKDTEEKAMPEDRKVALHNQLHSHYLSSIITTAENNGLDFPSYTSTAAISNGDGGFSLTLGMGFSQNFHRMQMDQDFQADHYPLLDSTPLLIDR